MKQEGDYASRGEGRIYYCIWAPEGPPKAVLQIVHGMAEHIERYEDFASYLNGLGFLVAAEDHMGHGKSAASQKGYFEGGWTAVAEDCHQLTVLLKEKYGNLPFGLLGHSMGSFLARTLLILYGGDYDAAVLSGTGWQPEMGLPLMEGLCSGVCRTKGDRYVSPMLNHLIFGGYNRRVEHPRTENDWLSRNHQNVDAYEKDENCGFPISSGMFRDLMEGLIYIEKYENLLKMKRETPVLLASGEMDPVGNYGKGVRKTLEKFRKAGMADVTMVLYPLDRHEILNEVDRSRVYEDISSWLLEKLRGKEET